MIQQFNDFIYARCTYILLNDVCLIRNQQFTFIHCGFSEETSPQVDSTLIFNPSDFNFIINVIRDLCHSILCLCCRIDVLFNYLLYSKFAFVPVVNQFTLLLIQSIRLFEQIKFLICVAILLQVLQDLIRMLVVTQILTQNESQAVFHLNHNGWIYICTVLLVFQGYL